MKLYLKAWLKSLTKQGSHTLLFLWYSLFKIYLNLCYLLKPLMVSNSFLEYGFDSVLYSL